MLISEAEAREYVPGLTANNVALGNLIRRVDEAIASFCKYPKATSTAARTMESTSYTLYLEGPGGRELELPVWPVTTITTIEDDVTEDFDGATHLVASSDYAQRGEHGEIVRLTQTSTQGAWSCTTDPVIKVVVTAGYATVPEALKQAAIELVAHKFNQRASIGKTSVTGGGLSASPSPIKIPDHVKELLDEYVINSIGQGSEVLP